MRRGRPYEIAIIGMGCRFAGASDLSGYFENIVGGQGLHAGSAARSLERRTFCDPTRRPTIAFPRAGAAIWIHPSLRRGRARDHAADHRGGEPEQFLVLDATVAALADAGLALMPQGDRVEIVIGRGNYFNRGNLTRLQHGRMIDQTLAILAALHPDGRRPSWMPSAPIFRPACRPSRRRRFPVS